MACITDRKNCGGGFLQRLQDIAASDVRYIILREKDLSEDEYVQLAQKAMKAAGGKLILHGHPDAAVKLGCRALHLPLQQLRELTPEQKGFFSVLGASCHSAEEAQEAERSGCTYITAGHVFATACKEGVPPRGLDFLREVCAAAGIPVYALGGIHTAEQVRQALAAGAAGACMMSGFMTGAYPWLRP